MPRDRKVSTRKPLERLYILCEGARTEPDYFQEIIDSSPLPTDLVQIVVIDVGKNTFRELVREGKKIRRQYSDQVWIVVDKDGYTKHKESFDMAMANNIDVAFSSISFETWILLHFCYTTKSFSKADDLISFINKKTTWKNIFTCKFTKTLPRLYNNFLKNYTDTAISNAIKLRSYMVGCHPSGMNICNMNPYTDVDLLVVTIRDLQRKFQR